MYCIPWTHDMWEWLHKTNVPFHTRHLFGATCNIYSIQNDLTKEYCWKSIKFVKRKKPCVHKTSFSDFKSKTQKIVLLLMVCCLICLNVLLNTPKIHSSQYIIYWHRIQIKTNVANKYEKQTSLFIARKLLHGETWRKMDDFSEDHPLFFFFFFFLLVLM